MIKYYILITTAMLFVICSEKKAAGQEIEELCPNAKVYENWNQIDYGPIELVDINGQAILNYPNFLILRNNFKHFGVIRVDNLFIFNKGMFRILI